MHGTHILVLSRGWLGVCMPAISRRCCFSEMHTNHKLARTRPARKAARSDESIAICRNLLILPRFTGWDAEGKEVWLADDACIVRLRSSAHLGCEEAASVLCLISLTMHSYIGKDLLLASHVVPTRMTCYRQVVSPLSLRGRRNCVLQNNGYTDLQTMRG